VTQPQVDDLELIGKLCAVLRTALEERGLSESVTDMLARLDLVVRFDRKYRIQDDEHLLVLHAHATKLAEPSAQQYEFDYDDELGQYG